MNEAPATGQQTTAIESIADLSKLVGAPARPATEIRILRDGENTFPAMIELSAWQRRPRWQRLAESIGALFGSSL